MRQKFGNAAWLSQSFVPVFFSSLLAADLKTSGQNLGFAYFLF